MDNGNPNNGNNYDCEFVQNDDDMDGLIDDNESAIMQDCYDNRFTSKSEIEANLIGEWELIGHGQGWVPTISQPCGFITITEDNLYFEFENSTIDTATVHTWEVNSAPSGIFTLELDPISNLDALFLYVFCDEYMYGDATPVDGNMYLFQKVN